MNRGMFLIVGVNEGHGPVMVPAWTVPVSSSVPPCSSFATKCRASPDTVPSSLSPPKVPVILPPVWLRSMEKWMGVPKKSAVANHRPATLGACPFGQNKQLFYISRRRRPRLKILSNPRRWLISLGLVVARTDYLRPEHEMADDTEHKRRRNQRPGARSQPQPRRRKAALNSPE